MTRNSLLILAAVILFAVAAVLVAIDDTVSAKLISVLLFSGLGSFAAGHLP